MSTSKAETTLPLALFLKLGSSAAFATSLIAVAALGIMMLFANSEGGAVYAEAVRAHTLTERALGPAMWIAGAILLVLVSVTAWLGALYLTFRVAGPLFRFSRNLEAASTDQMLPNIRANDYLHDVSHQLLASVGSMRAHRRRLDELVECAQRCLRADDLAGYSEAVARLRGELEYVKLD